MPDAFTIYHNPRCSKSRATLAILESHGVDIITVDYLKNPLNYSEVLSLCDKLNCSPYELIRTGDTNYRELASPPSPQDNKANAKLIAEIPGLMQRPVISTDRNAVIGRPPENVVTLINQNTE